MTFRPPARRLQQLLWVLLLCLPITSFLARVLDKSSLNCGGVVGPVLTKAERLPSCPVLGKIQSCLHFTILSILVQVRGRAFRRSPRVSFPSKSSTSASRAAVKQTPSYIVHKVLISHDLMPSTSHRMKTCQGHESIMQAPTLFSSFPNSLHKKNPKRCSRPT